MEKTTFETETYKKYAMNLNVKITIQLKFQFKKTW